MTDEEIAREFCLDAPYLGATGEINLMQALAAARADERERFREVRDVLGELKPNDFRSPKVAESVARVYHILDRALTGDEK